MPLFQIALIEKGPDDKETGRFAGPWAVMARTQERAQIKVLTDAGTITGMYMRPELGKDCEWEVVGRPF